MASPEEIRNTKRSTATQSGGTGSKSSPIPKAKAQKVVKRGSREQKVATPKQESTIACTSINDGDPGPSSRSSLSKLPSPATIYTMNPAGGDPEGIASSKSLETNQESVTDDLSRKTDVIEGEISDESDRHAEIRAELEEIKTEVLKSAQDLKVATREGMINSSVKDEFDKLNERYERLKIVYDKAQNEVTILETRLKNADVTLATLRQELVDVRKLLQEEKKRADGLEMDKIDLSKRIETLEQQVLVLRAELDTVKEERDRLKQESEAPKALKEIDYSTPNSSEVSSEAPDNGPMVQGAVIAGSSSTPIHHNPDDDTEKTDKQGSISKTVKNSETGATRTRILTCSSGTSSTKTRNFQVVKESVRTQQYGSAAVIGGVVLVEEKTTLLKLENTRHKRSSKDYYKK